MEMLREKSQNPLIWNDSLVKLREKWPEEPRLRKVRCENKEQYNVYRRCRNFLSTGKKYSRKKKKSPHYEQLCFVLDRNLER